MKRVKVGGGAELSGEIEPGDRVLRLDGKPLDSVSQADLASMTIGDEGTEALLEVVKACTGQEVMISVARIRSGRGLSFADKEVRGTQPTCFTSTNVQILTPEELRARVQPVVGRAELRKLARGSWRGGRSGRGVRSHGQKSAPQDS